MLLLQGSRRAIKLLSEKITSRVGQLNTYVPKQKGKAISHGLKPDGHVSNPFRSPFRKPQKMTGTNIVIALS